MLILGIETATEQVSVALGGHEGVIALFEMARGRRHAETLTPAIDFVCDQADIGLEEVGLIAVDVGPGLFTGMRVGLAAAKALALGLRLPMIGIPSLDLLAFRHRRADKVVVPVVDARKGEVFYALYRTVPGGVQQVVSRGSGRSPSWSPICWRAARRSCASATVRCATRPRSWRATTVRSPKMPTRRRPSSSRWPTPGRCARSGSARPTSAPSTCASPTPRSTGPAGPPSLVETHEAARSVRDRPEATVVVEAMRHRHVGAALAIERTAYPKPWSERVFHSELDQARDGARCYLVARRGRAVVGYAGLMFVLDEAHVTNVAVHQDHRRAGIARQLLGGLATAAIERGCVAWTLEVRASSTGAQALYRTFGFVPAGVRSKYYEENEDAIVMWCHDIASPQYAERLARLRDE